MTWERHRNLGEVARFWLQRHAMFRDLDRILRDGIQAALDGGDEAARFRPWLHRHLGLFLWQLEEHHGVEDDHYFPLFRRAEPELAAGFELLERDHDALHAALERLAMRANDVLQSGPRGAGAFSSSLGRLHAAQVALSPELGRHLDDEEDLVVPLMLERGETALLSPI